MPCAALADAALACQKQDGFFPWQLEAQEGPADTSATGMICAALKQGMALGVLSGEKYEKALTAGGTRPGAVCPGRAGVSVLG